MQVSSHDIAAEPFKRLVSPANVGAVAYRASPLAALQGAKRRTGLSANVMPAPTLVGVALLTLIAAALRLHDIGADGLWKNELFSLVWIRNSYSYLMTNGLLLETNPPFYYVVLKAWVGLFGSSETALRMPSALGSEGARKT